MFKCIGFLAIALSSFSLFAATSNLCPNEEGSYYVNDRNRNPVDGGFVSNSADIEDETVFIGKTAAVCGSAIISEYARITGNAIISGEAMVRNSARVFGNARVSGNAQIEDKAQVSGQAYIAGDAIIKGDAAIRGYTRLLTGVVQTGVRDDIEDPAIIAERERLRQEQERLRLEQERAELQAKINEIISLKQSIANLIERNEGFSQEIIFNGFGLYTYVSSPVIKQTDPICKIMKFSFSHTFDDNVQEKHQTHITDLDFKNIASFETTSFQTYFVRDMRLRDSPAFVGYKFTFKNEAIVKIITRIGGNLGHDEESSWTNNFKISTRARRSRGEDSNPEIYSRLSSYVYGLINLCSDPRIQ